MEFIINESQNKVLTVLRRIDHDWDLITEIVEEGLDLDSPCDFNTEVEYIKRICEDSANTYLLHYFESHNEKGFKVLMSYVIFKIKQRLGLYIRDFYLEEVEDC